MLLFSFSEKLKNKFHSYLKQSKGIHFESIFQNVYRYIEYLFQQVIHQEIHLTIRFEWIDDKTNNFEAFTQIMKSDEHLNPTESIIYLTNSFLHNKRNSSKKYIYYVILHECIHALGIMYDNKTKWKSFLNEDETQYIYNEKPSRAITEYNKLIKSRGIYSGIPLHNENCDHSDKHHILGVKDVFSTPLYTNVSQVTIGLLYDYYNNVDSDYKLNSGI